MGTPPDKDYTAAVMQTMYQFSKDGIFSDFQVKAGGRTVKCHKAIISAKSAFFRSISQSGSHEAALDSSVTTDEHGYILDLLIEFIYIGNCNITAYNVASLLLAADFIQLKELTEKCEQFLSSSLNVDKLASFYQLAKKFHLQALCDECMLLAKNNFSEAASSDFLLLLKSDEFCSLLMDEQLTVADEDDVIIALDRWLKSCKDGKPACEQFVEAIFPAIRIQFCSEATLAAMSKDRTTPAPLRLKILEYFQHGLQKESPARSSYSDTCRARQGAGTTTASAPAPRPASKSSSPSSGAVPKTPKPSAAARPADVREDILVLGGALPGFSFNPNIMFLEKDAGVAALPAAPLLATVQTQTLSACANEDFLIVSGGLDLTTERSMATVQIFDVRRKRWSNLPDIPHPVEFHGSTIANGNMYTLGGLYRENGEIKHKYNSIHMIELPAGKWTECDARLPSAVASPGIATVEDDIVIVGGRTDNGITSRTSRFNTKKNKLTRCRRMLKPDNPYCSTVSAEKCIYVLSGTQFSCYDVSNDSWSSLAMPMKPSDNPAMVLKHHRLIAMGGQDVKGDLKNPNDRVQVYDLKTQKWKALKNMPLKLTCHWAVVMKLSS